MDQTNNPLLIALVGPTGVGKTALAVSIAVQLGGEIVSADSRQVYRYMDIGTAKPTAEEQTQARHHLIDIIDPDEDFGLAVYQSLAYAAIDEVLDRGQTPLLVGGTGQYVRAVIEGWKIPRIPPDERLRDELFAQAEREGHESLYKKLLALDPAAQALIDARNVRRVVRALEVCLKSGWPFSEQRGKSPPPYRVVQIGLTTERETLYRRIDARIDQMIARGLVDEVRSLLDRGYDWTLPALSSLGYLQLKGYFEGATSLDECVASIKKETRRFIRHQYNWFRPGDPSIHWFDREQPTEGILHWLEI
ncbi:MAG: tRNA (adenosine(37)-N6)-dimethylallyltransferase MiaA [Anaerolineae bacterium]|nr:tRNA (adenosine(37)-N6)-dimethylallyltransferase MiaA [Anaerolineae bacterium]